MCIRDRLWGKSHFLKFYFVTGVGSGLLTMLFSLQSITPIVGASGAVYGVLLAYGLTYPNRQIYLYGIIPNTSIWFVIGIGMIAFMSSFNNISQVSHITHLSGMLIGYLMLKRMNGKSGKKRSKMFQKKCFLRELLIHLHLINLMKLLHFN